MVFPWFSRSKTETSSIGWETLPQSLWLWCPCLRHRVESCRIVLRLGRSIHHGWGSYRRLCIQTKRPNFAWCEEQICLDHAGFWLKITGWWIELVSQLGWWFPIYGNILYKMFQTTNQIRMWQTHRMWISLDDCSSATVLRDPPEMIDDRWDFSLPHEVKTHFDYSQYKCHNIASYLYITCILYMNLYDICIYT